MAAEDRWESAETARSYAAFARRYSTYRQTSRDLVALADLAPDTRVVDLACGTGITTETLLSVLGTAGQVVAVDASAAMLAEARKAVTDQRVRWLRLTAERLDTGISGAMDAVACNSAIWQTDVRATIRAVSQVLRPGGRFVFNVGADRLADHANPGPDPLTELMEDFAAREYGWTAPAPNTDPAGQELSESWLRHQLGDAGFSVEQVPALTYQCSLDEYRAWLSIPIFTRRRYGSLPYEQRMAALDHAYHRLAGSQEGPEPVTSAWVAFAARRDHP